MKTNSWTPADQAKDISSAPTHWLKFYEEAVVESDAWTAVHTMTYNDRNK